MYKHTISTWTVDGFRCDFNYACLSTRVATEEHHLGEYTFHDARAELHLESKCQFFVESCDAVPPLLEIPYLPSPHKFLSEVTPDNVGSTPNCESTLANFGRIDSVLISKN